MWSFSAARLKCNSVATGDEGLQLSQLHVPMVGGGQGRIFINRQHRSNDQGLLTPFWDRLSAHANDRAANEDAVREYFTLATTKWQYTRGAGRPA